MHDALVVITLNQSDCSDPRDYVYGVASLFEDPGGYEFDYTLSEAEVFADFTVHYFRKDRFAYDSRGAIDLLDHDRPAMDTVSAHRGLRSDLPTWCPDWRVARQTDNDLSRDHALDWHASGTKDFFYSRPSRITLELRGLIVSRLKLVSDPISKGVDSGGDLPWFKLGDSLCAFFALQGLESDFHMKRSIFAIFECILRTASFDTWSKDMLDNFSREFLSLLDLFDPYDLEALLAPVYLAAADPELFQAADFEIDTRIPLGDYRTIPGHFAHLFRRYGAGSRLFATKDGMQGVGYSGARQGDLVCIIYGSKTPQILRQVDDNDDKHFILVAGCVVDGLMSGEGLEMGLTEREFILV